MCGSSSQIRSQAAIQFSLGPGPHDRRALDEQDVAGEQHAGLGHVGERVAARVRRPDLDEVDAATADGQRVAAGERVGRQRQGDVAELERSEGVVVERVELGAEVVDRHRMKERRRDLGHLLRGGRGRPDRGALGHELVAPAVVAVGVGVDQRVDRHAVGDRLHRREHVAGQVEIEQRVDEQRRVLAGQQPGVAPAPAAVGLQVGEQAVAELVEAACVGGAGHGPQAARRRRDVDRADASRRTELPARRRGRRNAEHRGKDRHRERKPPHLANANHSARLARTLDDMPLSSFTPRTREWFESAFAGPTEAQIQAWPAIASGEHVLLAAPTGSGKTLAAFLSALDRLAATRGARQDAPGLRLAAQGALARHREEPARRRCAGSAQISGSPSARATPRRRTARRCSRSRRTS